MTPQVLRLATGLAALPYRAARRGAGLAVELVRIGLAGPDRVPRAVAATVAAADGMLADAGVPAPVRALLNPLVATPSPAPAATGGASVAPRGTDVPRVAEHAVPGPDGARRDLSATDGTSVAPGDTAGSSVAGGRVPPGAVIGEDVAATAGAVVLCDPAFELIHYLPRTATVRATPLLVVPPPGEPFLAADLAPGHSLVERLVASGQQVLLVSWAEGGDPGPALVTALDACLRIARTPTAALLGFGTGAVEIARLADAEPQRVAALTLVADGSDLPAAPRGPARRIERDVGDEGWWPEHAAWLHEHTGPDVTAPAELGGRGLPPLVPAPGALLAAQSPGRSCS